MSEFNYKEQHYITGGNGHAEQAPTQVPALQNAANELDRLIDEMQMSLKALEERLSPVLMPDDTKAVNPRDQAVAESHSHVVSHLRALARRTMAMLEALNSIKSRLEV